MQRACRKLMGDIETHRLSSPPNKMKKEDSHHCRKIWTAIIYYLPMAIFANYLIF